MAAPIALWHLRFENWSFRISFVFKAPDRPGWTTTGLGARAQDQLRSAKGAVGQASTEVHLYKA